jgi:enamine deaminase RidA (YjgF/YER057c/UK114 family)
MSRTYIQAGVFPGVSQMVRAGDTLYLSGQCSQDADGQVVGEGDPEAQARQCFRNIAELLATQGGTLADVVRLTTFFASVEAYPAYSAVKGELYPKDPPAGTAVVVNALLDPRFLLEVEVVAVLGD